MGDISTAQAADTLGVSAPTVRKWARDGIIGGHLVARGGRVVWRLNEDDVSAQRRARDQDAATQVTLASLAARVSFLEARETDSASSAASTSAGAVDALTLRAVVAEQAAADEARAAVIKHLLAALDASEAADSHRRAAITAAETAMGYKLVPDDPSTVRDTAQR